MNIVNTENDLKGLQRATESFTGRGLTNSQFEETWNITGIMRREIKRSGTFKDKLGDYANAFARTQKFDFMKAESIIRDIYKARFDQSMKATLTAYQDRQAALNEQDKSEILPSAHQVGKQIEHGKMVPFYRALDNEAVLLAENLGVTENAAKTFMKDAFEEHEDKSFYDWGKALEKQYYTPQVEKQRAERQIAKNESQKQTLKQSV